MGGGLLLTAFFHRKEIPITIKGDPLAILTGVLQALAVIPGVSRSAATIFALSLGNPSPSETLRKSYLISAPVILASSIYLFLQEPSLLFNGWPALVASFITGYITLKFLLQFSKKIDYFKFAFFFALVCLIGAFINFYKFR